MKQRSLVLAAFQLFLETRSFATAKTSTLISPAGLAGRGVDAELRASGAAVLVAVALLAGSAPAGAIPTDPENPENLPDCLTNTTASFSVSPRVITPGQSTTLSWQTYVPSGCPPQWYQLEAQSTQIGLTGDVGSTQPVGASGSMVVWPSSNTLWTLRARTATLATKAVGLESVTVMGDIYCAYPVITGASISDNNESGAGGSAAYMYFGSANGKKSGTFPSAIGGYDYDPTSAWASNFRGPYQVTGESSRPQWEWYDSAAGGLAVTWDSAGTPYLYGWQCTPPVTDPAAILSLTSMTERVYEHDECFLGICNPDDYVGSFTIDRAACDTDVFNGGPARGWSSKHDASVTGDISRVTYKLWCSSCRSEDSSCSSILALTPPPAPAPPPPAPAPPPLMLMVPDVLGYGFSEASTKLTAAGFITGRVFYSFSNSCYEFGVTRQSPEAWTTATEGTAVVLWVANPPEFCVE